MQQEDNSDPMEITNDTTSTEVDKAMSDAEADSATAVTDREAMIAKILPLHDQGLEEEEFGVFHWRIESWSALKERTNSPEFEVGGWKWKILLFPLGNTQTDNTSIYLEFADPKGAKQGWHSCVHFALVMSNPSDPTQWEYHQAHHRFNIDEADWGFTRFQEIKRMFQPTEKRSRPLVEDDQTVISAFVRVMKDPTGVLWHTFVNYDSKESTGFVGLKNQGATCYMNSLLQSLYVTNYFRKAVYEIPTENDDPTKSIALAMQRVFYNLQFSDVPVSTGELTKSFGWDSLDAFMQHDVQEFNRVLQDNLEAKMKGTPADGAISKLFVGRMTSYIKCINVNYESSRVEDFYDIQLNVKGCKNVFESFKEYISVETLEGENKYQAEGYGLQDAKKGVIFESFPPVLHLQLKRFEYDIQKDSMIKINDRYEFPEEIDLGEFLSTQADRSKPHKYLLHGVLVHSGDLHGGHYFALLKPGKEGKWMKFDDDRVTMAGMREVMEDNFGGEPTNPNMFPTFRPQMRNNKRFTNAYMLVYIRESEIDEVLAEVKSIPAHLQRRLEDEKALQEQRRRDQKEMHLYINVKVVTDEAFRNHQGFDLASFDDKSLSASDIRTFRVKKDDTLGSFKQTLAEQFHLAPERIRLWSLVNRQNQTVRPDAVLPESDMALDMEKIRDKHAGNRSSHLRFYLEMAEKPVNGKYIFSPEGVSSPQYMIFVKFYDPITAKIEGLGKFYVQRNSKVGDIIPIILEKKGLPPNTPLKLYEEIKPQMIEPMKPRLTFAQSEIQDGDIICAQKDFDKESADLRNQGRLPTVIEYFDYLLNRVIVQFKPKNDPHAAGFELTLTKKTYYDQVASNVASHLDADPLKIRFFTANASQMPKGIFKRNPNSTLNEMIAPQYNNQQPFNLLFYELMDVSIVELETKKMLKVIWLGTTTGKEESTQDLLLLKTSHVSDAIEALRSKVKMSPEGSHQIRMFEVSSSKISRELSGSEPITQIGEATVYAEEVPLEEQQINDGDKFIHVYHFSKEPIRAHGIPFRFLIKKDEVFADTKKRLQIRTGINDKDWAKVRFAHVPPVYSKATILDDDSIILSREKWGPEDLLGLDHVDKSGRSGRPGLFERPIFIRG